MERSIPANRTNSYNNSWKSHSSGQRPKFMFDFSIDQTIEADFSKRRQLKKPSDVWTLPSPKDLFKSDVWQNKHLMSSKGELNDMKNLLDEFNMKDWHQHTRRTNHAGDVINVVKKNINPEFLTQAWCKFYEIVSTFDLVPPDAVNSGLFNSMHLCEAPGAFITSLNHFLKLHYSNIKWEWRASTLNPYYEGNQLCFMINDDRFILHTLDNWEFGIDQSGNIFKLSNIDSLIAIAASLAPIHLVTADGSIDCSSDPGEQENIVSPLHHCETLVALSVLSKGGSFLLKMFTIFECSTLCLLYLLSCLFDSVNLFKPATSKEGNSEVYVVCTGFHGEMAVGPYLDVLRNNLESDNEKAMFSKDQIPLNFMCMISECSDYFKMVQMRVLERNMELKDKVLSKDEEYNLFQVKRRLAYSYIQRYRLQPLSLPNECIVGNEVITRTPKLNLDLLREEGSFNNKKLETSQIDEVILGLKAQLDIKCDWFQQSLSFTFSSDSLLEGCDLVVNPVFGTPVLSVYSSKFCQGTILKSWNKLCEIVGDIELNDSAQLDLEELYEMLPIMNEAPVKVCDMRGVRYSGNVCHFEHDCLVKVSELLKSMHNGEQLLVVGLPLLTRVSVGLAFYIAQTFNEVHLLNPVKAGYTLLYSGKRNCSEFFLQSLDNLVARTNDEKLLALHSIIPIKILVKDDWYRKILYCNHLHIKTRSLGVINHITCDPPLENVS